MTKKITGDKKPENAGTFPGRKKLKPANCVQGVSHC